MTNPETIVKEAIFVKSSAQYSDLPPANFPEYAFIGRSNVGKSSLINMLCSRHGLAKTSGTPGKTRLLNHFHINNTWYLVDLPGYGYAKVGKRQRVDFQKLITDYFKQRESLATVFQLIDSRHLMLESDIEFMFKIAENGLSLAFILTKIDKLSSNELAKRKSDFQQQISRYWEDFPPIFLSSAETRKGREDILSFINKANENYYQKT